MTETDNAGWFQRNYFLLRRLHSLAGLVPVGVFLVLHLTVNSTINNGPTAFQTAVDQIHFLGKLGLLEVVEIVFIFLPLLFHAVLGVQIWLAGAPTLGTYHSRQFMGNWRYTAQRITGGIAFVFIMVHLWHMHWLGKPFGGGQFDPHEASVTAAAAMQSAFWYAPFYVVGVVASVYHLANGIWTALITWGITIGPVSQRRSGWVCAVFGVALGLIGLSAVRGFQTLDVDKAPRLVETHNTDGSSAPAHVTH